MAIAKEAVFTMKLEPELREAFMAAAAADRPASQIVRDYFRQDKAYVEFLRRKAERARAGIAAGNWSTHEEVDVRAAVRRAELQRGIDETNS